MEKAAAQNSPTSQNTTVGERVIIYVIRETRETPPAMMRLSFLCSMYSSLSIRNGATSEKPAKSIRKCLEPQQRSQTRKEAQISSQTR
jgi:hypothetical protein